MHRVSRLNAVAVSAILFAVTAVFSQSQIDLPSRCSVGFRPKSDSSFSKTLPSTTWNPTTWAAYFYSSAAKERPDSVFTEGNAVASSARAYTYNAENNVVSYRRYSNGTQAEQVTYTYVNGWLSVKTSLEFNEYDTITDSLFYDASGRLTLDVQYAAKKDGSGTPVQKSAYTYVGNRTDTLAIVESYFMDPSFTDIDTITYTYNADSTVATRTVAYAGLFAGLKPAVSVYTYNAAKKIASVTVRRKDGPSTFTTTSRYLYGYNVIDSTQLFEKIVQDSNLTNTRFFLYTYDTDGNLRQERDSVVGSAVYRSLYAYTKIAATSVTLPTACARADRAVRLTMANGRIFCNLAVADARNLSLELRSVSGRLVAACGAEPAASGVMFRVSESAAPGAYIASVFAGGRRVAVARTVIVR
jgi:hypothetical protein